MDQENRLLVSYVGNLACVPPDDVLVVERDEDYVQACHALSIAGPSGAGVKVWVRSKIHLAWLRDFAKQIDCPCQFEEKTARLVLAERWNVSLPDWLTDAEVLEQGLLELRIESQKQRSSFTDRLLIHLLGPAFQSDELGAAQLVDVIKALVSDEAREAFRRHPVLSRCLDTKCQQWAEKGRGTWVEALCDQLPGNEGQVWKWLSVWSCLHTYPEKLLEFVLAPEQIGFVRKIPAEALHGLPLEATAREQALTQVELFLEEIRGQVTSSEAFQKVVACTSGKLPQEYRFVASILKDKRFPATEEDVAKVQAKFKSCPGVSASQLNSLRYAVMPSRPALLGPEEARTWQEWVRWTVEEYTPYRTWQVHNDHYDEELEKTVARFSAWYLQEYVSLHQEHDLSLVHCLRSLSSSGCEDELSLILLVDCLPLAFWNLLDAALRNVGLSRHDLQYRFAALPSTTEYNKPVMLSGDWQQAASTNHAAILSARASIEWGHKRVVYHSNLKSLSEMATPEEPAIVVLNFVDADELLHSDVESKNTSYEEELYRLFARLAESVSRLSKEWSGPREHFCVYAVTDHGACRILEEERRSFDSQVINKLFADEKHRFAVVDKARVGDVPDNLWALGYRFTHPFVSDDRVFFLPNGHNTVQQSNRPRGYMHGGVTPEEVIVPITMYKLVAVGWKTPAARFLYLELVRETGRARFYIQRVTTLQVEIQNPNPTDIRVLRISVASPETDLKSCETAVIPAGGVNTVRMNCYFEKSALGEKSLEIEIVYEIAGKQHTLPLTLECEFKSAVASGFSLRDL